MKRLFNYFSTHQFILFDKNTLSQRSVRITPIVFAFLLINTLCVLTGFVSSTYMRDVTYLTREQKIHIINSLDKFSVESYKQSLKDLNIKYPRVVFAQALIESGNFKSAIFRENNNSLGMKEAKIRPSTNIGTNRNHAVYNTWRDCVTDYALWQSYHLKNIHSEEEYIQLLGSIYATSPEYVQTIRKNLDKFENN